MFLTGANCKYHHHTASSLFFDRIYEKTPGLATNRGAKGTSSLAQINLFFFSISERYKETHNHNRSGALCLLVIAKPRYWLTFRSTFPPLDYYSAIPNIL